MEKKYNEDNHASKYPKILLRYLKSIVPDTSDGLVPSSKIRQEMDIFTQKDVNITVIEYLGYTLWLHSAELKAWLNFFTFYDIHKVRSESFKVEYELGLRQETNGRIRDFYRTLCSYDIKDSTEPDYVCMCACHMDGTNVDHIFDCCENTKKKYLDADGSFNERRYQNIEIGFADMNINMKGLKNVKDKDDKPS